MSEKTSVNQRAEQVMGRRLSPEDEERGVVAFDQPCELSYWCPVCRVEWDETLQWSEYASFIWCEKCNFDWPSALCVRVDGTPDPERPWTNLGRDAAVRIFLDSVEGVIARRPPAPPPVSEERRRELLRAGTSPSVGHLYGDGAAVRQDDFRSCAPLTWGELRQLLGAP